MYWTCWRFTCTTHPFVQTFAWKTVAKKTGIHRLMRREIASSLAAYRRACLVDGIGLHLRVLKPIEKLAELLPQIEISGVSDGF